jgi:hypothetical protein
MTKGIEIKDLTIGTGEEAAKDSVVALDMREFLRRGDEISPSPLFGTRMVIDLGRRDCIAGLRYGIPGMRVGGTREIVISPHLAYGKVGIPGRVPPNALLRCQVQLLEIRKNSALLPEDWQQGKILLLRRCPRANLEQHGWQLSVHESGNSWLTFNKTLPDEPQKQLHLNQVPILLEAEKAADLIMNAIELPTQMPEECVDWKSGFIDMQGGTVIKDGRNGELCMVFQVMECGITSILFGVHEDGPSFRESTFFKNIEELTSPHVCPGRALP